MSYDILLYPRRPGQDWAEVVEADEEETPEEVLQDEDLLAQGAETWRRIEGRLREQLDGPLETWVAEETGGDVFGELTATDTGLQVELFHGSAAVSFPYWERDDLGTFHRQVRETVRVVAEETGYEAYDPQTGEGFDGTFADEDGRAATRAVVADGAGETAPDAAPGAVRPADPRQDPAFLRRRGLLYLLLGVLLTAYGLWRLTGAGGTGWITIVVIVIGVVDLLGGLMMLSLARAAAEGREDVD